MQIERHEFEDILRAMVSRTLALQDAIKHLNRILVNLQDDIRYLQDAYLEED